MCCVLCAVHFPNAMCGVLYMFLQRHVAVCIACKTSSCIHTTQLSMWNGCAGLYHPDFQLLLAQHQVLVLVLLLERQTLQLQAIYLNSTDCPTYPFTAMSYIHVSLPPLTWLESYMYGYKLRHWWNRNMTCPSQLHLCFCRVQIQMSLSTSSSLQRMIAGC